MKKKYLILPVILTFLSLLYSEEIGSLFYNGDIGELKDSTIKVPDEAVGLSSRVRVFPPFYIPDVICGTPSLLLIIDHSASMSGSAGNDRWGERFTFSLEFIDSIRAKYPSTEVGIAVFREHLYFDPADDSRFVQCPGYDTGAYLPFFRLDSSYAPSGETGYQIVKKYLESDTVTDSLGNMYVDLKYKPSNIANNSGSANINVGFAAARHAFKSALYRHDRHFIIFLSDGEANECNGPNTSPFDFVTDVDSIPTTFTIFFTSTGQAPQNLVDMTNNIMVNGYSAMNPRSNLWSIDVSNLVDVLMNEIIIIISPPIVPLPVKIIINEDTAIANVYDTTDSIFTFDNLFPLTGVSTDFVYKIIYRILRDSILPNGDTILLLVDSLTSGEFNIVIQDGADIPDHYPDDFELNCWERNLGFFYKNTTVSSMNMGMDTLEIRFTEKEIDILYGYDSVSVTITNSKGNIDSETFDLTRRDTSFTKLFPLTKDSTPTLNDGILQLFDSDTVTAVFRNPKLPLDTIKLYVPFYPTTAINPNSYNNQKILSFNITNSSILYNLPTSGKTKLQIYNMKGRLISTLVDSYKHAGSYKVNWDSKRYGSGIYFIKLSTNGSEISKRVMVIK